MIIDEDVYLEHFGVKGMRWGVRKERAAGNRRRASEAQAEIDRLRSRSGIVPFKQARLQREAEIRDEQNAKAQAKEQGKLTPTQKKLAIGGAAAAAIIATYATYKIADSGEFSRLAKQGKAALSGEEFQWAKDASLSAPDMDLSDIRRKVVAPINPNYGEFGTKMNCRRATLAYEMRRRGNDVAATKSVAGTGQTIGGLARAIEPNAGDVPTTTYGILSRNVTETFKKERNPDALTPTIDLLSRYEGIGKKAVDLGDASDFAQGTRIFDALASNPDGSRGELGVTWTNGAGHSMAWEIIKGKPVIIDAQSGKVFENPRDLAEISGMIATAATTRLDDVPMNDDFLGRWLKNA